MKITIVTGSRADWGPLQMPISLMQQDSFFQGQILKIWGATVDQAFLSATQSFESERPDMVLLLGDRFEILAAATAAHLLRIPIAHIGGGDVSEGSYDDAMRDCITRMASIHFTTSTQSEVRVQYLMGQKNVHMVGSPGVDFIMHGEWKKERPFAEPYLVISYQPETARDKNDLSNELCIWALLRHLPDKKRVFIIPNPDRESDVIAGAIAKFVSEEANKGDVVYPALPSPEFLNLLYHCEEFIGNSSALYYEAPFLGVKTREIGKRQRGRVIPHGDGQASKRIVEILKA